MVFPLKTMSTLGIVKNAVPFGENPHGLREDARLPGQIGSIHSVESFFPGYLRTPDALYRYREFAKVDSGSKLSIPSESILPGDNYADLSHLAQLRRLVGDLPASVAVDITFCLETFGRRFRSH
jgi:hypothetical protein